MGPMANDLIYSVFTSASYDYYGKCQEMVIEKLNISIESESLVWNLLKSV